VKFRKELVEDSLEELPVAAAVDVVDA